MFWNRLIKNLHVVGLHKRLIGLGLHGYSHCFYKNARLFDFVLNFHDFFSFKSRRNGENGTLSSDNADIALERDNQVSLYLDERSLAARSCGDVAIIIQSDALEVGTRWHWQWSQCRHRPFDSCGLSRQYSLMQLIPAADYLRNDRALGVMHMYKNDIVNGTGNETGI